MTDKRPVCVKCSQNTKTIIRYFCVKNGIVLPYAKTYIHGDLWRCPECDSEIVEGFGDPMYGWNQSLLEPDTKFVGVVDG